MRRISVSFQASAGLLDLPQSQGCVDKALQVTKNWWKFQGELGLKSYLKCEARAGWRSKKPRFIQQLVQLLRAYCTGVEWYRPRQNTQTGIWGFSTILCKKQLYLIWHIISVVVSYQRVFEIKVNAFWLLTECNY